MSEYISPYGKPAGLAARLKAFRDRLCTDRSLPWLGTGIIADLELVMRLLNLREYAEWLKVHGPAEHQAFADDILADQFTLEAVQDAIGQSVLTHMPTDPVRGVELLDEKARDSDGDAVRQVLVSVGALAADDFETHVPDLVRALLS